MSDLASRLRADTEAICYPDGRKVGTAGHERAKEHLKERLSEIGCVPFSDGSFELPSM